MLAAGKGQCPRHWCFLSTVRALMAINSTNINLYTLYIASSKLSWVIFTHLNMSNYRLFACPPLPQWRCVFCQVRLLQPLPRMNSKERLQRLWNKPWQFRLVSSDSNNDSSPKMVLRSRMMRFLAPLQWSFRWCYWIFIQLMLNEANKWSLHLWKTIWSPWKNSLIALPIPMSQTNMATHHCTMLPVKDMLKACCFCLRQLLKKTNRRYRCNTIVHCSW